MRKEEFENVIKIPPNERYEYFVKKVVDFEEVWGLYDNGWAMTGDDQDNPLIPFWPKKEYAIFCATNEWKRYRPKAISLDDFISIVLPKMDNDRLAPSIFYNNVDSAVMKINVLLSDLNRELENYQ